MKNRGHTVAIVSMRHWEDGYGNVESFKLTDVPVLQVRHRLASDKLLLRDISCLLVRGLGGIAPKSLSRMRADLGVRQGIHEWLWAKRISAFAKKHRAEVVDAHWMSEAAAAALRLKQTMGVPYVVTSHGSDLASPDLQRIVSNADAVCPVSRHLARLLQDGWIEPGLPSSPTATSFDSAKVRIRSHGLPENVFAKNAVSQQNDRIVISSTGRLDPEKCPLDIVEAVANIAVEFPAVTLQFLGGGQLEQNILSRASQLGIGSRVFVTGGLPWDVVMEKLRDSNIYVQASQSEGFGVAALEAASQGLPAVVSRTGAHAEIVSEGVTGFVYEPCDVAGLTTALRKLVNNIELRRSMGTGAIAHVRKNFVFEDLMPRVEQMFLAVANGDPLPP